MQKWNVSADCWTPHGRKSFWSSTVEAPDFAGAIEATDQILARAGHHRYKITAKRAAGQEEQAA